jgi:AcrR family transcriptional regulator
MPSDTFLRLPDEKKRKILNAARREFSKKRFEEAKVVNICRGCCIPRNTFYSYFSSLEDIYDFLYHRIVGDASNPESYINSCGDYGGEEDFLYYVNLIDSGRGIRQVYDDLKSESPRNKILSHIRISLTLQYKEGLISIDELEQEYRLLSQGVI